MGLPGTAVYRLMAPTRTPRVGAFFVLLPTPDERILPVRLIWYVALGGCGRKCPAVRHRHLHSGPQWQPVSSGYPDGQHQRIDPPGACWTERGDLAHCHVPRLRSSSGAPGAPAGVMGSASV